MNARQLLLSVPLSQVSFEISLGDQVVALKARQLSAKQADEVALAASVGGKFSNLRFYNLRVIACVLEEESGEPVFTPEDLDSLQAMPNTVLQKLRDKVGEANSDISMSEIDDKKKQSKKTGGNKPSAT